MDCQWRPSVPEGSLIQKLQREKLYQSLVVLYADNDLDSLTICTFSLLYCTMCSQERERERETEAYSSTFIKYR